MDRKARLITIALLVGFFGDITLQLAASLFGGNWAGLPSYFSQHGKAESTFIASGMLGLFWALYILTGLPLNIQCVAVYGIVLDLVFRQARIFPSLDGYYNHLGYVASAIWAVIPICLPLLIEKAIWPKTVIW